MTTSLTINQSPQSDHALRYTTDNYDEWATKLAYAGPVGAALGIGFMIARRVPMLIDFPVGLWDFLVNDRIPEWMPSLSELMPEAKKHVIKYQAQIETKQKAEVELSEAREFYSEVRRTQQKVAKAAIDNAMIDKLARMFMDDSQPDNSHAQFVGLTGSGKGAAKRAFLKACLKIDPRAKILHINAKYKLKEFEEDYEPMFKGINQAAIGINEAVMLMEQRLANPNFDTAKSDKVIVVIDELKYVYDMFPEIAKSITTLTNVMRGANMRLVIDTQSYNASDHGLSDPCFSSFIKVILGGLQPKFLSTKMSHVNKNIVRQLEMQVTSFTQQNRRVALIVPAKGAPTVELMPHLKHAFEEMGTQHPTMQINGVNGAVVEYNSGERHPIDPPMMTKQRTKPLPTPPTWGSVEADVFMLDNDKLPEGKRVGQGKVAKAMGKGVPPYRKRLEGLRQLEKWEILTLDFSTPTPDLWQTPRGDKWILSNHHVALSGSGLPITQEQSAQKFKVDLEVYREYLGELIDYLATENPDFNPDEDVED